MVQVIPVSHGDFAFQSHVESRNRSKTGTEFHFLLLSAGWWALCGWGENRTVCVIHSVCLVTRCFSLAGCVWKSPSCGLRITRRADAIIIHSHWGKKACKLILKTAKCHSECSERGFMFPSLKMAVIFPDSLMHERQITEKAFVFLELVAARSCTYLTSLSVRRSYPCQIAARHSWGWSENEFILGVEQDFALLGELLCSIQEFSIHLY